MYTLGVSLLIYLKDVHSGYFPAHLSENYLTGISLHISLKDVHSGHFYFHIYPNGVSTGC